MRLTKKQWIQVAVSLIVAIWIFWFLYKDISFDALLLALSQTSLSWFGLSIAVSLMGFWVRAWRWKLLIDAGESQKTKTINSFWALMIGYLANLLVPRAGEVARCGVLTKTEDRQMGTLLGTVILERTFDMLFMVSIIFLAFLLERDLFVKLSSELVSLDSLKEKILQYLPLLIGGLIVTMIFIYLVFQKYKDSSLFKKIRHFLRDLINGVISLRKVDNQLGFWSSSVFIWFTYYLMLIFMAWAIPSTASLSLSSMLMVMVMGSIGMVAPVQGGIGTFHALVAFILMAYGLSNEEGKIFAAIIHGSQVLTVIILGLIALGFFFKITSRKESKSY
ncbi:lysylphosphatidylglycerol synthase transmembrane domain-containing protein [Aquiflexum lacus]|uniref:lysylphosphatidylglycerol synthase transmembrane domain-containing protein n=1 Tax=Aquiflexum lacus TaxID=2483805 RepID=UPI0018961D70|nr:lysylphosphatidylglycerol synthase transmembrane domain-containing protein [Aquiflexum lacus]